MLDASHTPVISATDNQRGAELRQELLELFLAEGFRSFGIADLARRLHRSKTTLYALGDSKEQITVGAVREFFRQSALLVEERTASVEGAADQVAAYLRAAAESLRRASPEFMADLAALAPARDVYEQNSLVAARRVAQLIDEGVRTGEFREVHASFIADAVAAIIRRIQAGLVREATGLADGEAFDQLADLVLNGVRVPANQVPGA